MKAENLVKPAQAAGSDHLEYARFVKDAEIL
jgi:hypothetical protein